MFCTYVLKELGKDSFYVGYTTNLKRRIIQHNMGETYSTKGRYWYIYCYFTFRSRYLAEDFERYLKTHSGRSFSKKHFGSDFKGIAEEKWIKHTLNLD